MHRRFTRYTELIEATPLHMHPYNLIKDQSNEIHRRNAQDKRNIMIRAPPIQSTPKISLRRHKTKLGDYHERIST